MLAIPDEHLLKFHACKDAKSLWEAIKNRFGGKKKSKKMQKTILNDGDDNQVNDMFKKGEGYHAVPLPYTGNYMPPRADLSFTRLDNFESDSEDENVFEPKEVKKTVKPSLEKIEFVNARNTIVENENKAKKSRKFSQSPRGGKITGKGKIRTGKLDFEDVYFVKELKFNHFSVSQMCDKKNNVLFTDTECVVLSHDFKLLDKSQVLFKVPRNHNMYSFDLKNVVPVGGLTCLFGKATLDKSNLWHRRLGHINLKTMNKLVRGNLVRGLPLKLFENDHTCVATQKRKQHKSSCIKNQMDHKVKEIRCDNKTEFKNRIMNKFWEMKGIRREFGVARTHQQNGVAERKNRTLIEAVKTMLADSKLPTTF
nr:ribonuclease H-like domain-containing protein [Tanacetum cinerariifolium]